MATIKLKEGGIITRIVHIDFKETVLILTDESGATQEAYICDVKSIEIN